MVHQLAEQWSHDPGRKLAEVVPSAWQATPRGIGDELGVDQRIVADLAGVLHDVAALAPLHSGSRIHNINNRQIRLLTQTVDDWHSSIIEDVCTGISNGGDERYNRIRQAASPKGGLHSRSTPSSNHAHALFTTKSGGTTLEGRRVGKVPVASCRSLSFRHY